MIGVVRLWRGNRMFVRHSLPRTAVPQRSGVEQRTVISENAVVADPDIAMIDRAAFVCRTERGSDADEGFAPAGSAVVRSRSAAVLERLSWISMSHTAPDSNQ